MPLISKSGTIFLYELWARYFVPTNTAGRNEVLLIYFMDDVIEPLLFGIHL